MNDEILNQTTIELLFENIDLKNPRCIFANYTNPGNVPIHILLPKASRSLSDTLSAFKNMETYTETDSINTHIIVDSNSLVKIPDMRPEHLNLRQIPVMFLDLASYIANSPELDKTLISFKRIIKSLATITHFKNFNCVCFVNTDLFSKSDLTDIAKFSESGPNILYSPVPAT